MTAFALLPASERRLIIDQIAARRGFPACDCREEFLGLLDPGTNLRHTRHGLQPGVEGRPQFQTPKLKNEY